MAQGGRRWTRAARAAGASRLCDKLGCVGKLSDSSVLALVLETSAFEEDCPRADIVVSLLRAPSNCAAPLIFDRQRLEEIGGNDLALRR